MLSLSGEESKGSSMGRFMCPSTRRSRGWGRIEARMRDWRVYVSELSQGYTCSEEECGKRQDSQQRVKLCNGRGPEITRTAVECGMGDSVQVCGNAEGCWARSLTAMGGVNLEGGSDDS